MLLPDVLRVVRELAKEGRPRFRASYVADQAGVSQDVARRSLVKLAAAGELVMNFELLSPVDDSTVAIFHEREQVPKMFALDESGDGEEFEVTPDLIWVTFSPSEELLAEVRSEQTDDATPTSSEGGPPGNLSGPRRPRAARATPTRSRPTSTGVLATLY
jgi:hypothetical protein